MGILDKIAEIEREIARTQKNKGWFEMLLDLSFISLPYLQPRNITWVCSKLNLPDIGINF